MTANRISLAVLLAFSAPMIVAAYPITCSVQRVQGKNDGSRPGASAQTLTTLTLDSTDNYSQKNAHIQITPSMYASVIPIEKDLWLNITETLAEGKTRTVGTHYPLALPKGEIVDELLETKGYLQIILTCEK